MARWDVDTFEYANKSFDLSLVDMTFGYPGEVYVSPDGNYAFVSIHQASASDESYIIRINLSTKFEINTGSYNQNLVLTSKDKNPSSVFFKSDGTKMYVSGNENTKIYQYNLSTAWDLSTATYYDDFSVSSQEGNPNAVCLSSDGTKMYVLGNDKNTIYQYGLSTAWNLGTASYSSIYLDVSGVEDNCTGLTFKNDGSRLYFIGTTNDKVYQYDLSTSWNVSTGSRASGYCYIGFDANPTGIDFRAYGDRFWVTGGATKKIYQYECPSFVPRVRIL